MKRSDRTLMTWSVGLGAFAVLTLLVTPMGGHHSAVASSTTASTPDSQTASTWKVGDPVPGDPANAVDSRPEPVPEEPSIAALSGSTSDATYLRYLHQSQYGAGAPDDVLISDAHEVCTAFDSQKTLDQVFDMNNFSGLNSWQRGTMIGTAVANYCPQYSQTVVQQFEAQGGNAGDPPATADSPTVGESRAGLPGAGLLTYGTYRAGRRAWRLGRHLHW